MANQANKDELTHDQMVEVIKGGGSVMHRGVHYTRIETLPSEAQLSAGDPAREDKAKVELEATIQRMQADLDALKARQDSAAGAGAGAKSSEPPPDSGKTEEVV